MKKRKPQLFDLNVEKILEHWGLPEAVREVIANALDEQALSGTAELEIVKRKDGWHVRDFGRGLRYRHLTQNENPEKHRRADAVVGKFGVGLKDALATFHRRGVDVTTKSRHSDITLVRAPKSDFSDVTTLHAAITPPSDPKQKGTDFILRGLSDANMAAAKDYFLKFRGDEELETTEYGAVLERRGDEPAHVYVKGVRVATEEQFLFSYNITSTTAQLQRALNRERTNVGRSAYQDRVKAILLKCRSEKVGQALADDLMRLPQGTNHDEITWLDVQEQAVRIVAARGKTVFVSAHQMSIFGATVQEARRDGYRIVFVPDRLVARLPNLRDLNGNPILDLGGFVKAWNESFEFDFVEPADLSADENNVWAILPSLLELAGDHARRVESVRVSNTMRLDEGNYETEGLWDSPNIVVKRSVLDSRRHFAAVLLHELGHASSRADHGSPAFMGAVDDLAGHAAELAVETGPAGHPRPKAKPARRSRPA